MKSILLKYSAVLLLLCAGAVCRARADAISIFFDQPVAQGTPGTMVQFTGVLDNHTAATLLINSSTVSLDAFGVQDIDTTPLLFNIFDLAPLATSNDIGLFTVSIPRSFAPGQYAGNLVILGGGDFDSQEVLGSATFAVNVAAVPEPACLGLLLTGVVLSRRRSRRR